MTQRFQIGDRVTMIPSLPKARLTPATVHKVYVKFPHSEALKQTVYGFQLDYHPFKDKPLYRELRYIELDEAGLERWKVTKR